MEKVKDSELNDNFERIEFLLAFTEYSLTGDKDKALILESVYHSLLDKQPTMTIQTANALQLSGMIDRAINLLEVEEDLTSEALLLLVICYQQKNDMSNYCIAAKKFAKSIIKFEDKYLLMFLNLMVEIRLLGQHSKFIKCDFDSSKTYVNDENEKLVNAVANLIFDDKPSGENCDFLYQIAMTNEDPVLVEILGSAFFASEAYESALNVLARHLEGKSAGRALSQYIHAASKMGKDYKHLLQLLENWRLTSPFNAQFCRLEVELRQDLVDWKTIVDICEYYLEHLPDDSAMLAVYANSLHLLNNEEYNLKIATLSDRVKLCDAHRPQHLIVVCDVLFIHGQIEAAFELLYPGSLDPEAIELRTAFAKLVLTRDDKNLPLTEYEVVKTGCFVKYEREDRAYYVELTEDMLNHQVYSSFLGKCKEDTVTVKRQIGNIKDTFKITRIMNKYLALFDQILNQSKEDPYAGLPFSLMNFDVNNPGSFIETLQSMFGDQNRISEHTKDVNFDAYYNEEISLSELISLEYNEKFINGYYN
ncbi:MAG: hypothetical protein EOO43_13550, partial [Flavobacterium sp.]